MAAAQQLPTRLHEQPQRGQNRQAQLVQARMHWQNATLQFSNYLWNEQQPHELPVATVRPQPLPRRLTAPDARLADNLSEQARHRHSELQRSRAKLAQLGVDNRLLRNKLLPKLTLRWAGGQGG